MAFAVLSVFLLAPAILAVPSPRAPLRELIKVQGGTSGKYIVRLKEGVAKSEVADVLPSSVVNQWSIINGFAVEGNDETLATLLSHPDVESVEEDGIAHTMAATTQMQAGWGLARVSSSNVLVADGNYNYTYDESAGEGVDIYIIDTGIFIDHSEFEGRASWGPTFAGTESTDEEGHGTHCAGIAASATYGVAKKASLIAVKVIPGSAEGAWSNVIDGIDWVAQHANPSERPAVASISLSGLGQPSVDAAVEALVAMGVHVTVAAGNQGYEVAWFSPARAPSANTIGATDIYDRRAYYSNIGSGIDLWAPGTEITSTWIGAPDATNTLSGTSMSSPLVAGLIAYIISLEGNMSPKDMSDKLKAMALKGMVWGLPLNTANLLAYNGLV